MELDIRKYVIPKFTLERDIPLLEKAQALALSVALAHPNAFWDALRLCSRLRILELAEDNPYLDAYLRLVAGEILDPSTHKVLESRGFVERRYVISGEIEGSTLDELVENVKRYYSYKFVPKVGLAKLIKEMPCKVTMSNYEDVALLQREGIAEVIVLPKGLLTDVQPVSAEKPVGELRNIIRELPPHHMQFVSELLNKIVLKSLDEY